MPKQLEIFELLESANSKKIKLGLDLLKESPTSIPIAKKRYLTLIRIKLGAQSTIWDLEEALLSKSEASFISKKLGKKTLTLSYLELDEGELIVKTIGAIFASFLNIEHLLTEINRCSSEENLEKKRADLYTNIELALNQLLDVGGAKSWYNTIIKKILTTKELTNVKIDYLKLLTWSEDKAIVRYFMLALVYMNRDAKKWFHINIIDAVPLPALTPIAWLAKNELKITLTTPYDESGNYTQIVPANPFSFKTKEALLIVDKVKQKIERPSIPLNDLLIPDTIGFKSLPEITEENVEHIRKIYSFLESQNRDNIKLGLELLKGIPELVPIAEKRYLPLVKAILGKKATIWDFQKAALDEDEVDFILEKVSSGTIDLSYCQENESDLIVNVLGAILSSVVDLEDLLIRLHNTPSIDYWWKISTDIYNKIDASIKVLDREGLKDGWYSKIISHVYQTDLLASIRLDHTSLSLLRDDSILVRYFWLAIGCMSRYNDEHIYVDVFQSDSPALTPIIWCLPYGARIRYSNIAVFTPPLTPFSFEKKNNVVVEFGDEEERVQYDLPKQATLDQLLEHV